MIEFWTTIQTVPAVDRQERAWEEGGTGASVGPPPKKCGCGIAIASHNQSIIGNGVF